LKALERPALLPEPEAALFSGKRWKFWGAGPLAAEPEVPAVAGAGDDPLLPPEEAPPDSLDEDVPTPLIAFVEAPLVWEAGEALVDAPPAPPPLGRESPSLDEALPFLDPLPADPAAELGFGLEGPDGGLPTLAPAAALDDDAILLAPPAAAAPAPAILAAATPAAPPTAKPPTASAPAPRAGPPETRAAAKFGANSDSMARMIAAVSIVIAS
jgi:hypothetical protein